MDVKVWRVLLLVYCNLAAIVEAYLAVTLSNTVFCASAASPKQSVRQSVLDHQQWSTSVEQQQLIDCRHKG